MKAVEVPVTLSLPASRTVRSEGVHVSSIIRCIAVESGILRPEWVEELSLVDVRKITDPAAVLRISIGLAFEEWYIPTILGPMGVQDHPGEMVVDGVYMTHDGESLDAIVIEKCNHYITRVHEVKATYKSVKTVGDMTSEWMYLAQIKAYCKGAGTTHARIHILFLCGDYRFPLTPQLKVWDLEFTPSEIEDNWRLLMDYKNYKMGTGRE